MKLFVGLGNPGREHAKQRHNVGFMAIDAIADRFEFTNWKNRFSGQTNDGRISGTRILLLKPQTFMNESGRSVSAAARYLKIDPSDVYVFYDEIDLVPGKLKIKTSGGNAGHNGLRSITAHFGNDYHRIRIGVGHPGQKDQVANHVLSNFSKSDLSWLEAMLEALSRSAALLADGKIDHYLSEVARELQPEKNADKARKTKPKNTAAQPRPSSETAERSTLKPHETPKAAKQADEKSATSLAENLKKWLRGPGETG